MLKDDEVNALLFDSLVESKVNEALTDMGDLVLKAEVEQLRWTHVEMTEHLQQMQKNQ